MAVPNEELLTSPRAFAQTVGVTHATILRWIHSGLLQSTRLPNGHYRVPYSELQRLLGAARREETRLN